VPVVPLRQIVDRAFSERYGVAAINVVNALTLEAVLAAAVEQRAPVIVQTSVKTVRGIGIDLLFAMWQELTAGIEVPVSLHLDHCPDRAFISSCLRKGWNSVLFDGSTLPVQENLRQRSRNCSRRPPRSPSGRSDRDLPAWRGHEPRFVRPGEWSCPSRGR
jgi:fructose/tagatose bisphosphate aldolase